MNFELIKCSNDDRNFRIEDFVIKILGFGWATNYDDERDF